MTERVKFILHPADSTCADNLHAWLMKFRELYPNDHFKLREKTIDHLRGLRAGYRRKSWNGLDGELAVRKAQQESDD
jgi:hypothetical protein